MRCGRRWLLTTTLWGPRSKPTGVASSEAELRGEDYFGPALNRAARVMSAGRQLARNAGVDEGVVLPSRHRTHGHGRSWQRTSSPGGRHGLP
jgi:hypothetical protein